MTRKYFPKNDEEELKQKVFPMVNTNTSSEGSSWFSNGVVMPVDKKFMRRHKNYVKKQEETALAKYNKDYLEEKIEEETQQRKSIEFLMICFIGIISCFLILWLIYWK